MPGPTSFDLNAVVAEIQRHAESIIRVAVVFKGPLSTNCGNCNGDIENEQCQACGTRMEAVVGSADGTPCEELYDQAQNAFPALPYLGIAINRPRRGPDDTFYMMVQIDLPNT